MNRLSKSENYHKSSDYGDDRTKNIFPNVLHQNLKESMLELWFGPVLQERNTAHWLFLIVGVKADENIYTRLKLA